jgi:hypothetical protein
MQTWNRNTLIIFNTIIKGLSIDDAVRSAAISRRAVYKAIAGHHLRDFAELLKTLTLELDHGTQIEAGE